VVTREHASVGEHAADLLRIQRVAAGALEQRGLGFCRQHGVVEQRGDQAGGVGIREG